MFLLCSRKQGGLTGPMVSAGVNTELQPTEDWGCLVQVWGGWDGQKSLEGHKSHQCSSPEAFSIN